MTTPDDDIPLQLLTDSVQGELSGGDARELRHRLAASARARAELAALQATDRALLEALDAAATAPRRRPRRSLLAPLLAAAALLVVVAVFTLTRRDDRTAGGNEFASVHVAPVGGARHPLFTDVHLQLTWENRARESGRVLQIQPLPLGGAAAVAAPTDAVPITVRARLTAPDGRVLHASLRPRDAARVDRTLVQDVALYDFEVDESGPRPYLGGGPTATGWTDDFDWTDAHMPSDQPRRWLPDQPGEWHIELEADTATPTTPGAWPQFAAPLRAETRLQLTAVVSDWGPEHDGLRARLIWPIAGGDLAEAPMALQVDNASGRTRRYNVVGATAAPIPQPLHLRLLTRAADAADFAALEQRRVRVKLSEDDLMVDHPAGTVRTLVVSPGYWQLPRATDEALEVAAELHFEATTFRSGDRTLWQGRLRTGAVRYDSR